MGKAAWVVVGAVVMALAGCSNGVGGASGSSVQVTRTGRPSQEFQTVSLACASIGSDPSRPALRCVHGDPEGGDGLEWVAWFDAPFAELPAGTTLEHGTHFHVTEISGAGDGYQWGAGGDSSWWSGDLMITLDGARTATFHGTMQTTAAVESFGLIPIMLSFDTVTATLP